MIYLTLPWPPTLNTMYPTSRSGHRFMSARGKLYGEAMRHVIEQQMPTNHETLAGRIGYRVVMCPPDKRKRDLSNHLKAIEDCLTKCGLWGDDSQVDEMQVMRGQVKSGGEVQMEVWELGKRKVAP